MSHDPQRLVSINRVSGQDLSRWLEAGEMTARRKRIPIHVKMLAHVHYRSVPQPAVDLITDPGPV